ncbi:hypothetical protein EVAR_100240_1 [Eumeta japonica]|uniref:Uncharacterized protein n=1 Tax=Eumeta variegata TaxID=151549 RepID=A0A4C1ZYN4_EUMVA|nr:hypothetical protein EVAR_100240_1 [Eumeta japonica]
MVSVKINTSPSLMKYSIHSHFEVASVAYIFSHCFLGVRKPLRRDGGGSSGIDGVRGKLRRVDFLVIYLSIILDRYKTLLLRPFHTAMVVRKKYCSSTAWSFL